MATTAAMQREHAAAMTNAMSARGSGADLGLSILADQKPVAAGDRPDDAEHRRPFEVDSIEHLARIGAAPRMTRAASASEASGRGLRPSEPTI